MTRVVVTGLGTVPPPGDDDHAVFDALMRGESALRPVFPELPKRAIAAQPPFDATRWFIKLQLAGVDRVSQIAVVAAELAMRDARCERGRRGRRGRPGTDRRLRRLRDWRGPLHSERPTAAPAYRRWRFLPSCRTGLRRTSREGTAFLVLEPEESERRRRATIHAVLSGWGTTCDATRLTKPDVDGQVRALREALRKGDLHPRDVGYCNAHGTATRIGEVVERNALATVWGDDLDRLRVSSTKALHGHLLGAAGALEALITALALEGSRVPPNAHCAMVDPDCALNLVLDEEVAAPGLEHAICNSFAFGGTNRVLLFSRG
ncbi:MAG: hypothetical protein ABI277_09910 [Burkholderiaceae bacterium]